MSNRCVFQSFQAEVKCFVLSFLWGKRRKVSADKPNKHQRKTKVHYWGRSKQRRVKWSPFLKKPGRVWGVWDENKIKNVFSIFHCGCGDVRHKPHIQDGWPHLYTRWHPCKNLSDPPTQSSAEETRGLHTPRDIKSDFTNTSTVFKKSKKPNSTIITVRLYKNPTFSG